MPATPAHPHLNSTDANSDSSASAGLDADAGAAAGVRLLSARGRKATPWKNGGGITHEIAAWPQDAGTEGFQWRVSLAQVETDGPFSVFPGTERTLTIVEGAGMELTVDGTPHTLTRRTPHDLPGDTSTDCRLTNGPVTNLNVMWRRTTPRLFVSTSLGSTPRSGSGSMAYEVDLAPLIGQGSRSKAHGMDLVLSGCRRGDGPVTADSRHWFWDPH